jgi:hypothetical protein
MKNKTLLPLLFALCSLLSACKTTPKTADLTPLESGVMPLDQGAAAYVLIDAANSRPIIDKLSYIPMNDKRMQQMLDRTQTAAMAVFMPSSDETRRFQLTSWGSYPAFGSNIAFGTNKDWIKLRSASPKNSYWYSEKSQMSVAVKPAQAYVLTSITKFPRNPVPSPEGVKIPGGFGEFVRGAALSCWLSDPGPILKKKLNDMGLQMEIPAEQLFISLLPADGQKYEANVKIIFQHTGQARIVANLLFIARRNFVPPAVPQPAPVSQSAEKNTNGASAQESAAMLSSLLFANPAVQEGNSILLKPPPLGVDEIALLFSMFSL